MPRPFLTPSDKAFRKDARSKGYLDPGGLGITAYYRDHGMLHPNDLEVGIPRREITMTVVPEWRLTHDVLMGDDWMHGGRSGKSKVVRAGRPGGYDDPEDWWSR